MAYTAEEYLNLASPEDTWIWKGLLPHGGSTLLYSNPKVGKSFIALGLAAAIADDTVKEYLSQPVIQHGRTLYIQLDTPRKLWKADYVVKLASEAARKNVYIVDRITPDLPQPFDIRTKLCSDWLRKEVDTVEPLVVMVDTIRRMHQGDENDSTIMSNVHEGFIQATQPAALLYLAHQRKPSQMGDQADSVSLMRGSSALTGAVDALIHMTKKRLTIQARSDVDEEIPVYQMENGFYSVNSKEAEITSFLMALSPEMGAREKDKAISEQFSVGERTARGWRREWEHGQAK